LWAGKARRELSAIAVRTPMEGLTETECRVAVLLAEGQTNREVASAMFVTQNTVQTHMKHIFQKLGVRSRTELAARVLSPPRRYRDLAEAARRAASSQAEVTRAQRIGR
jgi:DNA-binding NarL/FixJ family response regulator